MWAGTEETMNISVPRLTSSVQALPLNFRFSPNFDYSATHHRSASHSQLPRHRTWTSPYSDEELTNDASFVRQYAYPRQLRTSQAQRTLRYVRDATARSSEEPLDVKLDRLRARLAELEARHAQSAIVQPKSSSNVEFDEEHHEEASAEHAEEPHPAEHPAEPSAAQTSTAKPAGESHMDKTGDTGGGIDRALQHENSKKWAAKLHNKHIFERQVQIVGEFPQQIPGNGTGNATTATPTAGHETEGGDLTQKGARLEELKKKLHELQNALAKKTVQHSRHLQLEVKKPPMHAVLTNYDKKFIRRKRPSRYFAQHRKRRRDNYFDNS